MSPTISMEGTLLTAVIEAQQGQDVTTCNIPNTFVQTMWRKRTRMVIEPS